MPRVAVYCLLCKRELLITRSFAEAFKEINTHLERRHAISWVSPTGLSIHEYADAYVRYFRKSELDDYEKHIVSSIRLEIAKYREFYGYFLGGKPAVVITDVFAIYLESAKEAVLERLKGRKGKWIYPQKLKMYRKYAKLVREHYQTPRFLSNLKDYIKKSKKGRKEGIKEKKELTLLERPYPELYANAPREDFPLNHLKERKPVWRVKRINGQPVLERI